MSALCFCAKLGSFFEKIVINFPILQTDTIKKMDVNRFATRKSLAQGMLDLALLTANAAQLKYILTLGPTYQFYQLLLVLISASIGLQVRIWLLFGFKTMKNDVSYQKLQGNQATKPLIFSIEIKTTLITVIKS